MVQEPEPAIHRRPGARAGVGMLVALLGACGATGAQTPRQRNEEINRDLLETLLTSDVLTPVEDFDEDAYFSELERLYADAPRGEELEVRAEEWTPGADEAPINPYMEFGQRIWVHEESGFVVKPYAFPKGMGARVMALIEVYGDFEVAEAVVNGQGLPDVASQPLDAAVLDLRPGFDAEAFSTPRPSKTIGPTLVELSDWLFVRAQPEVLFEVERFINLFSAEARQIEIEAKIVEVTTSDSFDYGVVNSADTPVFGLPNSGTLINSIDYSFINTATGAEAIFGVSAVFDGVEFNALLEMVASHENVSIISRPKVAVREGGRADIVNTTDVPFFEIAAISSAGNFNTKLTFKPVGVQMYVVPHVMGDDTIILNINIEASQRTGTSVTLFQGGEEGAITVPEISLRKAATVVRLEPGQAVILGGLISERTLERERKVPFLGDIPVLGYLFKSHFQVREQTNVLFFIRPRLLQGIDLNPDF